MNFWEKLKRPIMVLAPMADVTDCAFRQIIAKYGKPDVMWTEFVSADGLMLANEKGKKKLMKDLQFSEEERPIVAQFFSAKPEIIEKASALALELGFDGIDINMGCPDKSIEKQGAGAAHIKNPKLAREIIKSAKKGAKSVNRQIPVSVKTRVGYSKNELTKWLPELLAEEPAVITIHARTRKEMSKVPAQWGYIKEAVEIRNKLGSKTLIFGNGDVKDLADAHMKAKESGADGVMLGRAIFGNPWLFSEKKPTTKEKLEVLIEHTKLFEKFLGETKNFSVMKKHFKAYINGFSGASELRTKLMETNNAKEVEKIISML
ncbi:MAG: tRNA-dihydrouridine synthase [Patescibacteria group bacterium]|nr:tRNA-dihydrouridine synthase [Patescibacteria group bacterium]